MTTPCFCRDHLRRQRACICPREIGLEATGLSRVLMSRRSGVCPWNCKSPLSVSVTTRLIDRPLERARRVSALQSARSSPQGRASLFPLKGGEAVTDQVNGDRDKRALRLEKARKELFDTLGTLRSGGTLTRKEADAVEAAIEDELIALRVRPLLSTTRSIE